MLAPHQGLTEAHLCKAHVLAVQETVGAVRVDVLTRIAQEDVGRVPCNLRNSMKGEPLKPAQCMRRASDIFETGPAPCGLASALHQSDNGTHEATW